MTATNPTPARSVNATAANGGSGTGPPRSTPARMPTTCSRAAAMLSSSTTTAANRRNAVGGAAGAGMGDGLGIGRRVYRPARRRVQCGRMSPRPRGALPQ